MSANKRQKCKRNAITLKDMNLRHTNNRYRISKSGIMCESQKLIETVRSYRIFRKREAMIGTSQIPKNVACDSTIVNRALIRVSLDSCKLCNSDTYFMKYYSLLWMYIEYLSRTVLHMSLFRMSIIMVLLSLSRITFGHGLLVDDPSFNGVLMKRDENTFYNISRDNFKHNIETGSPLTSSPVSKAFLDEMESSGRNVEAVLLKVATSTTKRSIPDNNHVPSLTTVATPLLTTSRYIDKSSHQHQINFHHRNYELDLERDHVLPTSAPNADILKSNSNPSYPNPNRHHNHDRERHRQQLNSAPAPAPSSPFNNKKTNGQPSTIPIHSADPPSYSPPARAFFTPPLPPEYQNPFADKPTLRGTNNEGIIASTGTFVNRRPIPPPSLMPGHERIPFRPSDLNGGTSANTGDIGSSSLPFSQITSVNSTAENEAKKVLNTPSFSRGNNVRFSGNEQKNVYDSNQHETTGGSNSEGVLQNNAQTTAKEVLPGIRRILNGSKGKSEIPEVLLKQVTTRPYTSFQQPSSSPVVLLDNISQNEGDSENTSLPSSNINKKKNTSEELDQDLMGSLNTSHNNEKSKSKQSNEQELVIANTNSVISSTVAATSTSFTTTSATESKTSILSSSPRSRSSSSSSTTASAAAAQNTWNIAWNIHVYLSVILFTILAVYSFYKMLTYNKLTYLFSQPYFVCIHLILVIICIARTFYLCYDAYNINFSFHTFVSELLLNLPATFLTISFSVLILFLFIKSLNHKNNRYSALIRPLTVVVGCGVHVVLCITLHYVESYTMHNHQQNIYYQQQLYRKQHHQQTYQQHTSGGNLLTSMSNTPNGVSDQPNYMSSGVITSPPPPRVLSLICQIIYIFICLCLGLLYLYLYRILKRILHSKSQNYIHGYQNLSYAIHITIATALLFILLAALQIFGAISISTTRFSITQSTPSEIDWLQWGYQFSLRLIEIAIITLISWVTGLKTGGSVGNVGLGNGEESRLGAGVENVNGDVFISGGTRKKYNGYHQHNQTNVAGFFLPCTTSSSSQEHFDTADYPVVCNANTNLHTYTMRTGKLIYDDSLVLNSLGNKPSHLENVGGRSAEYQLNQPIYHRTYDTSSSFHQNVGNHKTADTVQNNGYHRSRHDFHQYADYMTDDTNTDHYENPNFDLRDSGSSGVVNNTMQKINKTSTTSTTASSSGGSGSSGVSQQQHVLLLQSDSCYSEPLQQDCNSSLKYDFNNLERPFVGSHQKSHGYWSDDRSKSVSRSINNQRSKTYQATLDRFTYENPDRCSSNSTQSHLSNNGSRFMGYNSFDRRHNDVLSNNDGEGGGKLVHNESCMPNNSAKGSTSEQKTSAVQTLVPLDRHYHGQRNGGRLVSRNINGSGGGGADGVTDAKERDYDMVFGYSSLENRKNHAFSKNHRSADDDMISDSNVESTNLINDEDSSCMTSGINITDQSVSFNSNKASERLSNNGQQIQKQSTHSSKHNGKNNLEHDIDVSSEENTPPFAFENANIASSGGSMLLAEHGFVRFRALDDINNAQGVGIHNASIRNQNRSVNAHGKVQLQHAS